MTVVAPAPAARPRKRAQAASPAQAPRKPRRRAGLERQRMRRSPVAPGVLWVLVIATLLGGVVALNVGALRNSIQASRLEGDAAALRSQNSALESQIAGESLSGRINQLAQSYGMVQVQPGRGAYIRLHPRRRVHRPKRHAAPRGGAAAVSFARHGPAGKP